MEKQHDMKLTYEDVMLENHLKCNANLQTWINSQKLFDNGL